MTTKEVVKKQTTEIANLDELLAQRAAAITDNIKVGGRFISLRNQQFNLPDGEVVKGELDLVVLDYAYQFHYYSTPYNAQSQNSTPDCFSVGTSETSMTVAAPDPVSDNCASCPNNQWGSAGNGRKGKACANNIMLAVMFADLSRGNDVMVIKASPLAYRSVNQYLVNSTKVYGHPIRAITTATVEGSPNGGFKLVLESSGDNPDYKSFAQYLDQAHDAVMATPSVAVPLASGSSQLAARD